MDLNAEELSSVREEYKSTLVLPKEDAIPARQFFLCPVGLVGAGKSTVIKPLSERLSLVRISSDEIRKMLKERGAGYDQLLEVVGPLAEELAAQGFSLAFDGDCGNPKTKEMITELVDKVDAKVLWIHVNPPEEFIRLLPKAL